jgi:hypothetical protein
MNKPKNKADTCISTTRNLRTPISYFRNEKGALEAYNIHSQTDKAVFLDIGQFCSEEKAELQVPPASGLIPSSASLKIEKPSSVCRPNVL